MEWYEYLTNAALMGYMGKAATEYTIACGAGIVALNIITKLTKTKKDDQAWAEVKARLMLLAGKKGKK